MSDTKTTSTAPAIWPALTYKDARAEIVLPITDEDYGSRGFTARDPEGNVWSFGTYRGA